MLFLKTQNEITRGWPEWVKYSIYPIGNDIFSFCYFIILPTKYAKLYLRHCKRGLIKLAYVVG